MTAPELVVVTQDGHERREPLLGELTLGREPTNSVVVDDSYLSRRHCKVLLRPKGAAILDLKSYNGTFVNGQKIHEECLLMPGDVVRIGRTRLFVDWTEGGEEASAGVAAGQAPLRVRAPDLRPKDGVKPKLAEKPTALAPSYRELDLQALVAQEADPPRGLSGDKTPVPAAPGPEASAVARASGSHAKRQQGSTVSRDREGLKLIAQISRVLAGAEDESEFIDFAVQKLLEVIPAERAVVMRLDPSRRGLYAECVKNALPGRTDDQARRLGISHTIAKKVVRERVSVLVNDAVLDERFKDASSVEDLQVRSVLCVPIWSGDAISGLVYLDHLMHAYAFTESDRELCVAVANLLALGIGRRRRPSGPPAP